MSEQEKTSLNVRSEQDIDSEEGGIDERPGSTRRSSRLAIILSLMTLLVVAVSLFLGYRHWHGMQQSLLQMNSSLSQASRDQTVMRERLAETHQALQQQQQQIVLQEQALTDQRQLLEQERDSMRQQGVQLNRSLTAMQQRLGGNTKQWQVAEAEYLMRVANHRLTLMHDPLTALDALAAADERLRDTGDPSWSGVRQLLAQEMTGLRAVPKVDKDGMIASLSALAEQVEQLPLREEGVAINAIDTPAAEKSTQESDKGFDLQRIWQDLWDGFKSMMVIRHHQKPIAAMLSPEQGYFLRQNLRLKLEGASIALMGRNAGFYQESLRAS
ncbi:MAG: uroporphyrinogen-III C-methyltransferase, partial [Pseudomonadota bacterium]